MLRTIQGLLALGVLTACGTGAPPDGQRPDTGGEAPPATPAPTSTGQGTWDVANPTTIPAPTPDDTDAPPEPAPVRPNVLYVMIDDPGPERFRFYDTPVDGQELPTLEALADDGLVFTEAWGAPSCSPARASMLTGRHPFRHGIGRWIYPGGNDVELAQDEITLAELLARAPVPYTSAISGKWHLVSWGNDDPTFHPLNQGFVAHRGSLANPLDWIGGNAPGKRHYDFWQKNTDGEVALELTYMTVDTADEAITLIEDLPEPWFLFLSFNAPHSPWEVPPAPFPGSDLPEDAASADVFDAMLRTVDVELGRVIASIPTEVWARTTTFVSGDNGTPHQVIRDPYDPDRGKGTVWETGVDIPFLISGYGVAEGGREVDVPITLVDVLPTIAELAGVDPGLHVAGPLDGISLVPWMRDADEPHPDRIVYTESFTPAGPAPYGWHTWALRSDDYKLMDVGNGQLHLFDYRRMGIEENADLDLFDTRMTAEDLDALSELLDERDRLEAARWGTP